MRQPWPPARPFKVLSLDGGGIKGLYTAELLRRCEEELARGDSISRYFDLVAGTSTGGIIALGLSLGFSAAELLEFYVRDGRLIFPRLPGSWLGTIPRRVAGLFRPHLSYEALESALKQRFRDRLLGEAQTRVVIPAFMIPKTEIAVFKTDHHSDFKNDYKTEAWKVARATSAAPTYLKGHEHKPDGRIFIDGGVWANNPIMVALVDVLSAYDVRPESIEVLSIGTGNPPLELKTGARFTGMWFWREIIKAAMFLTTDNATAQAKLLLGPERCLRIEPTAMSACIEMDDYDRAFRELLPLAELHFDEFKSRLTPFFFHKVLPRERHYTGV